MFSRIFQGSRRFVNVAALACVAFLLTACVPQGQEHVNTELFKDRGDMSSRVAALKPGMYKSKVFAQLGVQPDRFARMSTIEVQQSVYGNAQVHGSPAELEAFRRRLAACEGYSLPYRKLDSSASLGFGKLKVENRGYDLRLVLVFANGRLMKSAVEGTTQVRQENDQYLWPMLLRKGIGLAF
jgi:hypothetical protein